MRKTLESLPNELILLIFDYLSLFDLCQSFLHVNNIRLQELLLSKRHSFMPSSLCYQQMSRLLNDNNHFTFQCFTNFIETLVLDSSYASNMFCTHLRERLRNTSPFNVYLSSMTQIISETEDYICDVAVVLLLPLNSINHNLQHLHLIFEQPDYNYGFSLMILVKYLISFKTMTLEVKRGRLENHFYFNNIIVLY
jgi:hypothetical protein